MKINQPPRQSCDSSDHSTLEWIVSLLFWSQMVFAASLYGVVALAPKLTVYVELQNEHLKTQTQLVSLENHINELEKVVVSLQDDPRVIEELARLDLDASRPDEKRIPLAGGVSLQSRLTESTYVPEVGRAWYQPLLRAFSENASLRATSLGVAAALVVISFTFFHPSQARSFHSGWRNLRAGISACVARYRGRPVS